MPEFPYLKTIHAQYMAEMNRRFGRLKKLVRETVVDNDYFRLKKGHVIGHAQALRPPFKFTENPEKINAFMDWLREAQDDEVLEVIERKGRSVVAHKEWQNVYVRRSYEKGISFAHAKLEEQGVEVSDEDIRAIFNRPVHADSLGMLYTRNFNELVGITEAMDQQISRVLTDGLAQGKNPRVIARDIASRIDKIGITRARTLARTEVNRAQNEATINRYADYGVKKVELIVGAGPCPSNICPDHAGVYAVRDAAGLLPLHPNCYSDDTEVLTDHGWKLFKDVIESDLIFSMNPDTLETEYIQHISAGFSTVDEHNRGSFEQNSGIDSRWKPPLFTLGEGGSRNIRYYRPLCSSPSRKIHRRR